MKQINIFLTWVFMLLWMVKGSEKINERVFLDQNLFFIIMDYCGFSLKDYFAVATSNHTLFRILGNPNNYMVYEGREEYSRIMMRSQVINDLVGLHLSWNEIFSSKQVIISSHAMQIITMFENPDKSTADTDDMKYTDMYSSLFFNYFTYNPLEKELKVRTCLIDPWIRQLKPKKNNNTSVFRSVFKQQPFKMPVAILYKKRYWYIMDTFFCTPTTKKNVLGISLRDECCWKKFYFFFNEIHIKYTHVDKSTGEKHHVFMTLVLQDCQIIRADKQLFDRKSEYKWFYKILHLPQPK